MKFRDLEVGRSCTFPNKFDNNDNRRFCTWRKTSNTTAEWSGFLPRPLSVQEPSTSVLMKYRFESTDVDEDEEVEPTD